MSGGGSKPGERRGGRKPGTPNKVTAELAGLARVHTADAIARLVAIMNGIVAEGETKELLWGAGVSKLNGARHGSPFG